MRQCEDLKAQMEINDKSSTCGSVSSMKSDGAAQSKDLVNLKDRNHALEKKLKKYHSHCAFLEEEKAAVLEVIKSCLPGESAKDMSTAIMALCEKLNSLEEECSLQDEEKRKATSYLKELDKLRSNMADLEEKFADSENRISILSRSEKELQNKLKYTREEVNSLRKKQDDTERSTLESEHDMSRKISYLEKENLQLHKELKAAKGLLRNTVNQSNTDHMTLPDPMIELQRLSTCSPLKSFRAMKDSITNKSPDAETPHTKEKSPRKSPASHSARKRSVGLFADKREINDENTTECNTS